MVVFFGLLGATSRGRLILDTEYYTTLMIAKTPLMITKVSMRACSAKSHKTRWLIPMVSPYRMKDCKQCGSYRYPATRICRFSTRHVTQCQGGIEKKEYYRDEVQGRPLVCLFSEGRKKLQTLGVIVGPCCKFFLGLKGMEARSQWASQISLIMKMKYLFLLGQPLYSLQQRLTTLTCVHHL